MKRKGVGADSIPILFIFILTPVLLINSVSLVDALSKQSGFAVDDLRMSARTESVAGNYLHDYSRLGVRHSVNQKAHDLASSAGGMNWNGTSVKNNKASATAAIGNLESSSEDYLYQNYIRGFRPSNCDVNLSGYDISLSETGDHLDSAYSPNSSAEVVCSFSKGNASYWVDTSLRREMEFETNRYVMLAEDTKKVFDSVQSAWKSTSRKHSGSANMCGSSGVLSQAKSNAVSNAESQYESDAKSSYSSSDIDTDFSFDQESFGVKGYTYSSTNGPTSNGTYCGCTCTQRSVCTPGSGGRRTTGGGGGGGSIPPECGRGSCASDEYASGCNTYHDASAEVKVNNATASIAIKDDEHKVLTSQGYSSLIFEVSNYVQKFN